MGATMGGKERTNVRMILREVGEFLAQLCRT